MKIPSNFHLQPQNLIDFYWPTKANTKRARKHTPLRSGTQAAWSHSMRGKVCIGAWVDNSRPSRTFDILVETLSFLLAHPFTAASDEDEVTSTTCSIHQQRLNSFVELELICCFSDKYQEAGGSKCSLQVQPFHLQRREHSI